MNYIINFGAGIFIGAGLILPGVSGGVLAIAFGIYDEMILAISHLFTNFKKNLLFLTPLFMGLVIGILFFGKIIAYFFIKYPLPIKFAFMGLILGSLPILFSKLRSKGKLNFKVTPFMIALGLGLGLSLLGRNYFVNETVATLNGGILSYLKLFTAGMLYAVGKVIPGVSSSFLLMVLGLYEYVLSLIANPLSISASDFSNVLVILVGFVTGLIILVKLVENLLNKHSYIAYSAIIGFVLGSIVIIYPGFTFDLNGALAVLLFIVMLLISSSFSLYESKKDHEEK